MKFKAMIILLIFIFSIKTFAQTAYFPNDAWQRKKPVELKMNAILLDSAVNFAISHENKVDKDLRVSMLKSYVREPNYYIKGPTRRREGPNGIIIKNGYIVAEWGDINQVDMTFSVTKSFLSTVTGLALQDKLIKNINDPVSKYVTDGTFDGKHNQKITWEHLLHQSSDWTGTLFGLHDWADRPPREGEKDDWTRRKLETPGQVFEYNDVRVNLLAYALLNVWRKPLPVVLKEKIMDPIGASVTWRWHGYEDSFVTLDGLSMQSVSGGGHHGGGLFSNSLDLARLGLLFLRQGNWNGQQLLDKSWIKAATSPSPSAGDYGYMWWLNHDKKWKDLSPEIYHAAGYGGNYIIIDPTNDLVVITRWLDNDSLEEFIKLVVNSVQK